MSSKSSNKGSGGEYEQLSSSALWYLVPLIQSLLQGLSVGCQYPSVFANSVKYSKCKMVLFCSRILRMTDLFSSEVILKKLNVP